MERHLHPVAYPTRNINYRENQVVLNCGTKFIQRRSFPKIDFLSADRQQSWINLVNLKRPGLNIKRVAPTDIL